MHMRAESAPNSKISSPVESPEELTIRDPEPEHVDGNAPTPRSKSNPDTQELQELSASPDPLGATSNVTAVTLNSWIASAPASDRKPTLSREIVLPIRRKVAASKTKDVRDIILLDEEHEQEQEQELFDQSPVTKDLRMISFVPP